MFQLAHPHMTTGKTIALTRQTFSGKMMFLLFNILSRSAIAVLPRRKHLLMSWLAILISGSSAFSKPSLSIQNFSVHIMLKPNLENFEHYSASVRDDCNCVVVWTFFGIAFLWSGMKNDLFQSCGHCWVFQICWHIECSTFTTSSFTLWNCSAGTP